MKQLLPIGSIIQLNTGWVWEVKEDNKIVYPDTKQESSLLFVSKKDYTVLHKPAQPRGETER